MCDEKEGIRCKLLGIVNRLELNRVILYAETAREQYQIMCGHTLRDCWELVRRCSFIMHPIEAMRGGCICILGPFHFDVYSYPILT